MDQSSGSAPSVECILTKGVPVSAGMHNVSPKTAEKEKSCPLDASGLAASGSSTGINHAQSGSGMPASHSFHESPPGRMPPDFIHAPPVPHVPNSGMAHEGEMPVVGLDMDSWINTRAPASGHLSPSSLRQGHRSYTSAQDSGSPHAGAGHYASALADVAIARHGSTLPMSPQHTYGFGIEQHFKQGIGGVGRDPSGYCSGAERHPHQYPQYGQYSAGYGDENDVRSVRDVRVLPERVAEPVPFEWTPQQGPLQGQVLSGYRQQGAFGGWQERSDHNADQLVFNGLRGLGGFYPPFSTFSHASVESSARGGFQDQGYGAGHGHVPAHGWGQQYGSSSPRARFHHADSITRPQGGYYEQIAASTGYMSAAGMPSRPSMDRGGRGGRGRGRGGVGGGADGGRAVVNSQVMEEFRAGFFQPTSVREIVGHVTEFARDKIGSRFLLSQFDVGGEATRAAIFFELLPDALSLMTDLYGNFICQRFLEAGEREQRMQLGACLRDQVVNLSLHPFGCRVVQKALEGLPPDGKLAIAAELDGHVMKCVQDANGNHVLQQVVAHIKGEQLHFLLRTFEGNMFRLSTHPYGCRVVQRVMENCRDEHVSNLLDEILGQVSELLTDQFGNFVIQHILKHGKPDLRSIVVQHVMGNVLSLSLHKYSSNVIERCLEYTSASEKRDIVEEILAPTMAVLLSSPSHTLPEDSSGLPLTPLQILIKDPYGNYVAQRLIDVAEDTQRAAFIEVLRSYAPVLKQYTYGKHILIRLEKMATASILPTGPGHATIPAHASHRHAGGGDGALLVSVPAGLPRNLSSGSVGQAMSRSGSSTLQGMGVAPILSRSASYNMLQGMGSSMSRSGSYTMLQGTSGGGTWSGSGASTQTSSPGPHPTAPPTATGYAPLITSNLGRR